MIPYISIPSEKKMYIKKTYLHQYVTGTVGWFYVLQKLHKALQGRLIVSVNENRTEILLLDYHLRPLQCHIQDKTHYLKKINSLSFLPYNTILFTIAMLEKTLFSMTTTFYRLAVLLWEQKWQLFFAKNVHVKTYRTHYFECAMKILILLMIFTWNGTIIM